MLVVNRWYTRWCWGGGGGSSAAGADASPQTPNPSPTPIVVELEAGTTISSTYPGAPVSAVGGGGGGAKGTLLNVEQLDVRELVEQLVHWSWC